MVYTLVSSVPAGVKGGTPSASTAPPPPPLPPSGKKGGRRGRQQQQQARATSPSPTSDAPGGGDSKAAGSSKGKGSGSADAAAAVPDGAAGGGPDGGGGEGGGETAEAQARSMVMKDLAEGQSGQVRVQGGGRGGSVMALMVGCGNSEGQGWSGNTRRCGCLSVCVFGGGAACWIKAGCVVASDVKVTDGKDPAEGQRIWLRGRVDR